MYSGSVTGRVVAVKKQSLKIVFVLVDITFRV